MVTLLKKIRRIIVRTFIPKSSYYLFGIPSRSTKPLSDRYGYDRGLPIDRYYIEQFIKANKDAITGACLEIHDIAYIQKYGHDVIRADALDVDPKNKQATIIANLKDVECVSDNAYDCLVVTHTLGMIDDFSAAIGECYRILKPGGVLLVTLAAFNKIEYQDLNFWRFTTASAKYSFQKYFKPESVFVGSYGNVLSVQAFWVGASADDLSEVELEENDPAYPIIITVKAVK